jgi:hypothetical protein
MPSRLEDTAQKIQWGDDHRARIEGGRSSVEITDGNIYLAMSVRNAGTGIAVLHAWHVEPDVPRAPAQGPDLDRFRTEARELRTDLDQFRPHIRDLYIPAGEVGFWQAAIRDQNDAAYAKLVEVIQRRELFTIDVLYGDHESGRRTISRFAITPGSESVWLCAVVRHWSLDHPER